jgi:septal ring factor EnvC (AmiA/AmiB activator)
LLTVSSILLCGIVVAYVGSATDYKQKSDEYRTQMQSAKEMQNKASEELKQSKDKFEQAELKLEQQIATLKSDLNKAQTDLAAAEREKARLLDETARAQSSSTAATKTYAEQGKLLESTLAELDKARTDGVKLKKELDETTNTLIQKMAIIDTLEKKLRELQQTTAEFQSRLSTPLISMGQQPAPAAVVTPQTAAAKTVEPSSNIDLNGLVTAVDMKNSMASISLGSVDGVREGMRFHVTRADNFICDIMIISVDVEESVGVLELVEYQPQVGDHATTNL